MMLAQKGDVSFVRYDQRTKDHKHHYEHAFPGDIDEMDDKEKHEEEEQLKWSGRFGGECREFSVSASAARLLLKLAFVQVGSWTTSGAVCLTGVLILWMVSEHVKCGVLLVSCKRWRYTHHKLPHSLSLPTSYRRYVATVAPCLAFGGLLQELTNDEVGVAETLLAQSITGILFAIFGGQPLMILQPTGPVVVSWEGSES
jgi:hypothetical protein